MSKTARSVMKAAIWHNLKNKGQVAKVHLPTECSAAVLPSFSTSSSALGNRARFSMCV